MLAASLRAASWASEAPIPTEQEYGGGTVTCPRCGGVWWVVYDEVYIEETNDEHQYLYLQADDPDG